MSWFLPGERTPLVPPPRPDRWRGPPAAGQGAGGCGGLDDPGGRAGRLHSGGEREQEDLDHPARPPNRAIRHGRRLPPEMMSFSPGSPPILSGYHGSLVPAHSREHVREPGRVLFRCLLRFTRLAEERSTNFPSKRRSIARRRRPRRSSRHRLRCRRGGKAVLPGADGPAAGDDTALDGARRRTGVGVRVDRQISQNRR